MIYVAIISDNVEEGEESDEEESDEEEELTDEQQEQYISLMTRSR